MFLLHSLKHPDEVRILREVYGDAFVTVSVYTPKATRRKVLSERINRSRNEYHPEKFETKAEELIDRDEKALGEDFGQNVRDTFPEGDIFLDATKPEELSTQIKRAVEILFRHPNRTPTADEYGLFHAKAAALRSADLSRQVGAVIATDDGEIIAAGCNEVPKAGGGAFWESQNSRRDTDRRDFAVGHDSSVRMKHELLIELFDRLKAQRWLSDNHQSVESSTLVDQALYDSNVSVLSGTRVASIVEFGRIVHAEMSAITEAARRGIAIKGATLYCTTFPCHMCARHIIATGIRRVVYVEPYPKSMAKDLYPGLLDVDHDPEADENAVKFRPFVGISPRRYIEFFEMPTRKDKRGHVVEWKPQEAKPRVKQFQTYLDVEAALVEQLAKNRVAWGVKTSAAERD